MVERIYIMKYLICDSWGAELKAFKNEDERTRWLKRYAYNSGVNWIVYDVSRFPFKVSSRTLHICEE